MRLRRSRRQVRRSVSGLGTHSAVSENLKLEGGYRPVSVRNRTHIPDPRTHLLAAAIQDALTLQ